MGFLNNRCFTRNATACGILVCACIHCTHKRISPSLLMCVFEDSGLWDGTGFLWCDWLLCVWFGGCVCAARKFIKVCNSEAERASVMKILLFSSHVAITEWEHNRFVYSPLLA